MIPQHTRGQGVVIDIFDFLSVINLGLYVVTNFSVMSLSYCSQNAPLKVMYVPFGLDMQNAPLGARSTKVLAGIRKRHD